MKQSLQNLLSTFRQLKAWGVSGAWSALRRLPHERRIAKTLAKSARQHVGTVPRRGITVVAPMSGAHSLSKAMRDFVVRLRETNVPHQVFDTFGREGRAARDDYEALLTPISEFDLLKYDHVVEMLTSPLPKGLPVKRCRIAFWEGEAGVLDVFPYLAESDTVIALSDFNAAYFRRALPPTVNVAKIRYPLAPLPKGIPDRAAARTRFGIAAEDFVVFYNFDIGSAGRKNPEGTLNAFAKAFAGEKGCRLLLKINGARQAIERMDELWSTAMRLGIAEQMTIATEYLSQTDLYSLTNACDVYMSLHRAEGFGLGIAEAMSLGKACIATDYSSTTEFCRPDTAIPIPCRLVPIGKEEGFCRHMELWAEPDVVAAVAALRRLKDDGAFRDKLGQTARKFVSEHYSPESFWQSIESFLDT